MGFEFDQRVPTSETEKAVIPAPSEEDITAALELIDENQTLRNHPGVLRLIETNFVTPSGEQLDPGDYLSKVLTMIKERDQAANESGEAQQDRITRILNSLATHDEGTRV